MPLSYGFNNCLEPILPTTSINNFTVCPAVAGNFLIEPFTIVSSNLVPSSNTRRTSKSGVPNFALLGIEKTLANKEIALLSSN